MNKAPSEPEAGPPTVDSGRLPGIDRAVVEPQVFAERLRLLAKQCRGLMLSGAIVSTLLAILQWRIVEHERIVEWLVLLALADQLSFRYTGYWMRHFDDPGQQRRALRHILSTLACTGAVWGLASWMLYVPGNFEYELVTILVLFGVTMATVVLFSTFGIAIVTRAIAVWIPPIAHTLYVGDRLHIYLGAGYLAFVGFTITFGWRVSNEHIASIFRLFENRLLNQRLAESQASLARSNTDLQRNNEALKTALQRIEEMSVRDELTGVHNRRFLTRRLDAACDRRQQYGRTMSIALVDVDHFKKINDTYGHNVGDDVLKFLAVEARSRLRPDDLFARYGGEEFVCLLPDTDADTAAAVGERLRKAIAEESPRRTPHGIEVTVSIGIAVYEPGESVKDWLRRSDEALYSAKHQGRNRLVVAPKPPPVQLQAAG
ncbi:MAG: diguanylate cyclase [Nevskia sp.]|nr:diguanylate cyclase [Nevskia sp.]